MESVPFGQAGPRNLEVMNDQSKWPLQDTLALKRYKVQRNQHGPDRLDGTDLGILLPVVKDLKITVVDRKTKEIYEYDSIEELVGDGWIVD